MIDELRLFVPMGMRIVSALPPMVAVLSLPVISCVRASWLAEY